MDQSIIRSELLTLNSDQVAALAPYLWVFGGCVVTLILSVMKVISPKWPVFLTTVATAILGIIHSAELLHVPSQLLFNNMMVGDYYANFFNIVFLSCAGLTAMASFRYLDREKLQHTEYYVLLLFSTLGMMLMTAALDLVVLFISFELMSITVYCLVGFRRADRKSNEGALKYFILGSAASAIMLYGVALLYGATGTTNMREILALTQSEPARMTAMFSLGAWLVLLGFLFKIASVPFHMWMPDVYEGAPTPVTGFMTTGLKAAAFATLIRVFISLGYAKGQVNDILWVIAVLTMLGGNIVALTQTNLKRMLAYSSIAHTGYLLIGIIAGGTTELGYAPVVVYLTTYAIMNLGAFVVLSMIAAREDQGLNLHDLSGFSRRQPWLAFAMAVFMFSMAGLPPTAGFAAKYLLLYSAIQAGQIWLVVIAVLCSAIAVYYYLRVLVYMYMRDPVGSASSHRLGAWSAAVVAAMVVLTIQIGVLPARLVHAAKRAVASL